MFNWQKCQRTAADSGEQPQVTLHQKCHFPWMQGLVFPWLRESVGLGDLLK